MGLLKKLIGLARPATPVAPPALPPDPNAPNLFEKQFMTWSVAAIQKAGIPCRPAPGFVLKVGVRNQELSLRSFYDADHSRDGVDAVLGAARNLADGPAPPSGHDHGHGHDH